MNLIEYITVGDAVAGMRGWDVPAKLQTPTRDPGTGPSNGIPTSGSDTTTEMKIGPSNRIIADQKESPVLRDPGNSTVLPEITPLTTQTPRAGTRVNGAIRCTNQDGAPVTTKGVMNAASSTIFGVARSAGDLTKDPLTRDTRGMGLQTIVGARERIPAEVEVGIVFK